jgi:hypothetical protein
MSANEPLSPVARTQSDWAAQKKVQHVWAWVVAEQSAETGGSTGGSTGGAVEEARSDTACLALGRALAEEGATALLLGSYVSCLQNLGFKLGHTPSQRDRRAGSLIQGFLGAQNEAQATRLLRVYAEPIEVAPSVCALRTPPLEVLGEHPAEADALLADWVERSCEQLLRRRCKRVIVEGEAPAIARLALELRALGIAQCAGLEGQLRTPQTPHAQPSLLEKVAGLFRRGSP